MFQLANNTIGSDNDWDLYKLQTIIWTNDGLVYWPANAYMRQSVSINKMECHENPLIWLNSDLVTEI